MNVTIAVALIMGIISPVLVIFIRHWLTYRKKKPDTIRETLYMSEKVLAKLDYIKEAFLSDRVWVTQFHNGGNFYPSGKSMAKFSVIYEVVGAGTASIQSLFQNIQVNLFSKSINQLLLNDAIIISDYRDETIATYGLKYIADDTGCKSGYLLAIKTIDDKFIGVMGLDYTKKKHVLDAEDINELQIHATSIGGVLMK